MNGLCPKSFEVILTLSKVSLSCLALTSAQVQVIGSPEWQAYKNAELAHIAPSIGPLAAEGRNHAQELLAWEQANLVHTANAQAFVASGRGKRQVSVVGSPEWQAWKQAELNHIAPSEGPLAHVGRNHAQELLAHQQAELVHTANAQAFVAGGFGRRKRQVQVEGSPEWQAYKNAELAFIAPSLGPTPGNFAQAQLDFVAPAPGPTPVNYAQAQLNYQQEALNFIASGAGK